MQWDESRALFIETARQVLGLMDHATDWTGPGLGEWDLGALAAHTARALQTPLHYLDQPATGPAELDGPAAYFVAYLNARDDRLTEAIARRATDASAGCADPAGMFRDAVMTLEHALTGLDPETVVTTPFGAMTLADYLPTRLFEVVVHGLDVAAATGRSWSPPGAALRSAFRILADVAVARGEAVDLIRILTGRSGGGHAAPVLR